MEDEFVRLTHTGEGHTYKFEVPLSRLSGGRSYETECPFCFKKYKATENGISAL